jgi:hypothetical protein
MRDEAMRETSGFGNAVKRRLANEAHTSRCLRTGIDVRVENNAILLETPVLSEEEKKRKKERSDDNVVW